MKRIAIAVWVLFAVAGCTRNASEGNIVLQVLDFRGHQPLGLKAATAETAKPAAAYRALAGEVTAETGTITNVCLVDSETPPEELGTIDGSTDCAVGDEDDASNFKREEGEKIALVDVNGDGITDSIAFGVTPGSSEFAELTSINFREDGGYILTKNDAVIYHPGDTITVHVYGWVPEPELLHVELWNNWNGGFHYWSSAEREVEGTIDFEVRMIIPSDWPQTNESTGAAYFSYPVSERGYYNGDNFVILNGDGSDPAEDDGLPPTKGKVLIANGAEAVSSPSVKVRLSAENAAFYRMASNKGDLEGVPWSAMTNDKATMAPWMLDEGEDGERVVWAQFASEFGAVSEYVSDAVRIDATHIQILNLAVTPTLGGGSTVFQISFSLSEPADGGLTVTFGGLPLADLVCVGLNCTASYTVMGSETEGEIDVSVRAVDAVGWVAHEEIDVVLDLTPPETSFTGNVPAGTVASSTAGFGLTSDESPVTYECSLDGAAFAACPAAVSLSGLSDGAHTFAARAIDAAGNVDPTPATTAWVVDTSAPETFITSAPSGTVNTASASIGFTSPATDVAGYQCRLDGAAFAACTSATSLTALSDGPHSFEVRAVDASGNYDLTPAIATWIVDTQPPQTLIATAPSGTVYSANASVVFYSTAADLAGFQCSVNGAAWAACTSPDDLTGLVDGTQTFLVAAIDAAGNIDPTPASATWTVSLVPPDTTITTGPTGVQNTTTAAFTFNSDKPGTFECRLDTGTFAACSTPDSLTGLTEGSHTFEVRAIDTEGTVDPTPASRTFTVDTTPPDTTITAAPPAMTNLTLAQLTFTADEPSSFQCNLDGNGGLGYVSCTSPSAFAGLADGVHTFSVRAVDLAGNMDLSPASVTWTVDTVAPTVANLTVSAARATTGDTLTLTFDVSEVPASLTVTVAGNVATYASNIGTHYTYTYTVAGGEPEGTATIVVTAGDLAGNLGTATKTTVLDFTPPDTLITSAPAAFINDVSALIDFTSSEPGSTFECQVNGGGYGSCPAPHQESPLVEGLYTFEVRAIDTVGLTDPTPAQTQFTVDYTACPAPVAGKMSVTVNPPLTSDQLTGTNGAVEGGATVKVYADAGLTISLASFTADANGAFPAGNIGDDVGDSSQQVYVTCVDPAGNESTATPMRNPRIAPRVTKALVTISIAVDTNGYSSFGNPGDWLAVQWNNGPDGDNNAIVTSATASIPSLGLGPVTMFDMGSGTYLGLFHLTAGTFDGTTTAEITVVGEAGLTTGPVQSSNSVKVDVEIPPAPASIVAYATGTLLAVTWSTSTAADLDKYKTFYGTSSADTALATTSAGVTTATAAVPSCTSQYYGVRAVDDAGNESSLKSGGPVSISVDKPSIVAWGGIGSAAAKLMSSDPSSSVQLYFALATEVTGAPPWTSPYPQYMQSPITMQSGINRLTPLKGGTDYLVTARATKSTCNSEFTTPIAVTTLYATAHNGGFAICPGCTYWGFPGRWYFGSLGFAVAGVGDAYGADGKEDVITAVPGQTLALLVGGDPLDEVAYMYDYYATNDVVGGGPELASAGDVNGDGKEDFLMGSPATSTAGKFLRGMARVIDGVSHATLFTVWGDQTGQQLGYSVSSAGDLTGDGKSEIIAGSVGCLSFSCSDTTATAGVVKIARANGTLLRTHTGPVTGSFFGVSVHGGVDVTGDGVPDYVVGAPGHNGTNAPIGSVHVYNGATGVEILTLYGTADEKFGFAVRLAIANGTGGNAPRVYVGAPSRAGAPGKVYVYDMSGTRINVLDGSLPEASENFGAALTSGGDMSGDGTDEVIVGDPNIPLSSQYGTGKAYAYSVDKDALTFELFGDSTDGGFGYAMDFLSDFNGDGVNDLVIGAPGAAVDGIWNAGKLYFISISAN